MKLEDMIELIKTVSESKVTNFQYEEGNERLTISTGGAVLTQQPLPAAETETVDVKPEVSVPDLASVVKAGEELQGNLVCSPLVGTFYSAPAEDAEDYVKPGQIVKKGQVLAIVEAMKLMNEIESDFEGVVEEIYVKKGETVEFGQPLFKIS